MQISLNIKDGDDKISSLILNVLIGEVDSALARATTPIQNRVKTLFGTAIANCPEMISLRGGKLQGELGVTGPEQRQQVLFKQWIDSIQIQHTKLRKYSNGLRGGFTLGMILADFNDVLSMAVAQQFTEKGELLPWLEWLLLNGDTIIVRDYHVEVAKRGSLSRTGLAIMSTGGRWRVPPEFSGTIRNNFVTRTLDSIEPNIHDIIQEEVTKAI